MDNTHCVAIARGPFVYCVESTDNSTISDLRAVRIPDTAEFSEEELDEEGLCKTGFENGIGGKAVLLKTTVLTVGGSDDGTSKELTLIPYFMWANRGKSNHRVWLPRM